MTFGNPMEGTRTIQPPVQLAGPVTTEQTRCVTGIWLSILVKQRVHDGSVSATEPIVKISPVLCTKLAMIAARVVMRQPDAAVHDGADARYE